MAKQVSSGTPTASSKKAPAIVHERAGVLSVRGFAITALRVAIIGGFLILWEVASGRWIEPFLISSPSHIISSLITGFTSGDLTQHTWVTLQEIAIGFPLGALSGIALGYAFGRSRS